MAGAGAMNGLLTTLTVEPPGVALLTMHDVDRKNALTIAMVEELEQQCATVNRDEGVKALILAGLDDYFSTGADRDVIDQLIAGRASPRDLLLPRVLLDVPIPVIAAMAGHAVGGGLALGICADLTLIARESRYGATFMRYGFTPGLGLTSLLEQVLGVSLAHEMLLTGQTYRGSRLDGRGFNYVLPRSDVLAKARELAAVIAEKPRRALVALKGSLSAPKRARFEAARGTETLMHEITFATPDVRRLIDELLD